MDNKSTHNGFMDAFSKDHAKDLAARYGALTFGQKPKNQIGIFYIVITIISLILVASGAVGQGFETIELYGLMAGIGIYVILPFSYF